MLDIKYIKEKPDEVIDRLAIKGKDAKEEIEAMLSNYFKVGSYDFCKECSVSDLESMIKSYIDGIKSVRLSISSSISETDDMVISPDVNQILTLGEIAFTITGGIDE